MYLALSMLFWNLISKAWASGNHFALVAFGFLGVIFGTGLCVSLFNTLRVVRGRAESADAGRHALSGTAATPAPGSCEPRAKRSGFRNSRLADGSARPVTTRDRSSSAEGRMSSRPVGVACLYRALPAARPRWCGGRQPARPHPARVAAPSCSRGPVVGTAETLAEGSTSSGVADFDGFRRVRGMNRGKPLAGPVMAV